MFKTNIANPLGLRNSLNKTEDNRPLLEMRVEHGGVSFDCLVLIDSGSSVHFILPASYIKAMGLNIIRTLTVIGSTGDDEMLFFDPRVNVSFALEGGQSATSSVTVCCYLTEFNASIVQPPMATALAPLRATATRPAPFTAMPTHRAVGHYSNILPAPKRVSVGILAMRSLKLEMEMNYVGL